MKAAVTTRYGSPDVIEIRDVPTPIPRENEVLVRVHASSICYGDRMFRSGPFIIRLLTGFRGPRHSILGVDFAGIVESVGQAVTRFAPGDRVYGGRGNKFGAHAEFACVAEDGLIAHKPETMTFAEAGTVFVGAACALHFIRKLHIQPGERVLVHGASGSLGTFAVQLAAERGGLVTAVCSAANRELVMSLGADQVIDYATRDFTDSGPIFDVVIDILGKAGFPRSLKALKPRGRYALVGFDGGPARIVRVLASALLTQLRRRAQITTGAANPSQADLTHLRELIDAGKLRSVVSRSYKLREIHEAYRYADGGHKVGNVAVLIA